MMGNAVYLRRSGVLFQTIALAACAMWLSATCRAIAQQEPSASADTDIVQPFVTETTAVVVKVDPSRISLPNVARLMEALSTETQALAQEVLRQAEGGVEYVKGVSDNQPVYATVGIPFSRSHRPYFVFWKRSGAADLKRLSTFIDERLEIEAEVRVHGDYVVASAMDEADVARTMAASAVSRSDDVTAAFQAVAPYPVQLLLLPPAYVRRTVEELPFELPPELGGGSSRLFTRGLQWAAVGVDPAKLRATLVVRSASESAARDLAAYLPKMLRCASEAMEWDVDDKIRTTLFDSLLKLLEPKVEGNHITIDIDGSEAAVANLRIIDLLQQTLESQTRRQRNIKRFTQIVTAMLNYHDTYKSFPPADKHRDEEGKPKLSWRVYLLPFLNQGQLYDEFHLDEPWDSPHNKKLLDKMPDIYRSTSFVVPPEGAVKTGYTTFLAPVGEDTVFGTATPTKMSDIADGMSHTIVLVEVVPERAMPWTAPADYEFDPDNPAAGIQMGDEGRWLAAVADMTVQQLPSDIPARTVLYLFQMSDGQAISLQKLR